MDVYLTTNGIYRLIGSGNDHIILQNNKDVYYITKFENKLYKWVNGVCQEFKYQYIVKIDPRMEINQIHTFLQLFNVSFIIVKGILCKVVSNDGMVVNLIDQSSQQHLSITVKKIDRKSLFDKDSTAFFTVNGVSKNLTENEIYVID